LYQPILAAPSAAPAYVPVPYLVFSLLNPKEFIVETNSLNVLMEQKRALTALNATSGIRYDPLKQHWVCPLSEHDSLSYALHGAGAASTALPRTVYYSI
jgi:hypothetical protein